MRSNKTIAEVVKNRLCTGCGTCVGTCPYEAIEVVSNHSKGGRYDESPLEHKGTSRVQSDLTTIWRHIQLLRGSVLFRYTGSD